MNRDMNRNIKNITNDIIYELGKKTRIQRHELGQGNNRSQHHHHRDRAEHQLSGLSQGNQDDISELHSDITTGLGQSRAGLGHSRSKGRMKKASKPQNRSGRHQVVEA